MLRRNGIDARLGGITDNYGRPEDHAFVIIFYENSPIFALDPWAGIAGTFNGSVAN